MPELAEVETIKRGLSPILTNQKIESIYIHHDALRYPLDKDAILSLEGKIITSISRRAKYLLWTISDNTCLAMHFGMSGTIRINPGNLSPHDHVQFITASGTVLSYKDHRRFGMIEHYSDTTAFEVEKALGVEPFSDHFTLEYLQWQLIKRTCSFKSFLMNQTIIAGLGNIYVNEILFEAKILPFRSVNGIQSHEIEPLHHAIKSVLTKAIKAGGSTLQDHRQVDGKLGYFQHQFNVYGREGLPCVICQKTVWKTVQNNRGTFYCYYCQH